MISFAIKLSLINKIDTLRKQIILVGIQEGLLSEKSIKLSQKLDHYLMKYRKWNNIEKTAENYGNLLQQYLLFIKSF